MRTKCAKYSNLIGQLIAVHYCQNGRLRNYQSFIDANLTNSPHAAGCGKTQPHMRRYTESHHYQCSSMRKFTTVYAAVHRKSPLDMRQFAEIHSRICGSIQKVTTTHTAVCGKLQLHTQRNTDRQSHAECYVYMFKGHTRPNFNSLLCCDVQ